MMFRCLMAGHRPGTEDHHFLSHVALMSAVVHGDMVFVMGGLDMDRAVWCADIRDLVSH